MSATVLGILLLVGIFVAVVLWRMAKRYAWRKVNQHVFSRREHREGGRLVAERLHLTVRTPPAQAWDAVLETVETVPEPPALATATYVLQTGVQRVVFAHGNKITPRVFTAALELRESGDRVDGTWEVLTWTLTDGVVAKVDAMKQLREQVEAGLRRADPKYASTVVTASAG